MYYRFTKEIEDAKFTPVIVKEKRDFWEAVKEILSKEMKEE